MERSYTPVCSLTDTGVHRHPLPASAAGTTEPCTEGETLDLLIKLYADGKMSRYLASLKKGKDCMIARKGLGRASSHSLVRNCRNIQKGQRSGLPHSKLNPWICPGCHGECWWYVRSWLDDNLNSLHSILKTRVERHVAITTTVIA